MNTKIKQCKGCEKNFPLRNFPKNHKSPDGHNWYCKSCHNEITRTQQKRYLNKHKSGELKIWNVKLCAKCKTVKDADEFYKNLRTKSGLTSRCKKCTLEYQKTRRLKS